VKVEQIVGSGGGGCTGAPVWKGDKNVLAALFLDVSTVTAPAAAPIFNALLLLMPLFLPGIALFASSFGLAMLLSFVQNCIGNAVFRSGSGIYHSRKSRVNVEIEVYPYHLIAFLLVKTRI
jgi:hypothetical protein